MYLLHQIVERSAREFPHRVAVVGPDASLTYDRLNELADAHALNLFRIGVRPGDRVGVCAGKSPATVAAIIGVLKCGAAYVPLDVGAPAARLQAVASDCDCGVLLVDAAGASRLRASSSAMRLLRLDEVVPIDSDDSVWREFADSRDAAVRNRIAVTEQSLAYILYTSGSTGTPKGVMIDHRAALSFVEWAASEFDVRPDDHISSHAPFHFDLSIFDLFVTFNAGATVHLVPPHAALFPIQLARFIADQRITVWYSVPSALIQLALRANLGEYDLSALRLVLFAGEVFPIKHLRRLHELLPAPTYYNLYGPTETNVCTFHRVEQLPSEEDGALPIGRACANTQIFMIDADGDPLSDPAPGDEGELCATGPGLMRGYWDRPAESREVLYTVRDAAGGLERRIYRTGDIVRLDDAGEYHFLGRRDGMIKTRGYRVEAGEVESILNSHPMVEEAVVLAEAHEEFGNILTACVLLLERELAVAPAELRAYCAERLPAYMVPSEIFLKEKIPRTSTGKVDRRALATEVAGKSQKRAQAGGKRNA